MLPSTVTLNVGSPAADVVFSQTGDNTGGATNYVAPSPQGDLEGRPTLSVRHETTNSGLVRTNVKIKVPQYDDTNDVYVGHEQVDITSVRRASHATTETDRCLEMAEKFLTNQRDELAQAEY